MALKPFFSIRFTRKLPNENQGKKDFQKKIRSTEGVARWKNRFLEKPASQAQIH
ncbi:hypothetical protein A33Q_2621 [Indibacter alkaliphilus LW1]|uniref:Uncharacterized protein n=1 Tax=Indibacter alkaliphilus (strain CCUG 57479 / KCTC 22604 / LW1) TaxID=1189612 RepID=S2E1S9_INDAL|nr:hypothetical protein A33Q_2621 [Indibacter alkaliphilus LW1]